ncbi:MAG: putative DNA-binding domain-containing protein [Hyphomicrobiaceae bacterium]|nr:putative DNA-binding domain-containing protein [Hyphomicrobiaceae bacterium]
MSRLSETQTGFAHAVRNADAAVPEGVVSHLRDKPRKRFGIYRNNVYVSLINVLEGRFPVVARLLGEEFFKATARVFVEHHPPASPVLMRYGGAFPEFLETFEPVSDLPWLPDVARLEWAWNLAYHAADRDPISPEALATIDPASADSLVFELHSAVQVVRSPYPVVTIWSENSKDREPGQIDAGAGGEDGLIVRPGIAVDVRHLPPGGAAFITALSERKTLGSAAERALAEDESFDLQANLGGLIGSGAVVALETA